ncbi:branched-chain amino acid ABC transporter substrate-binding protein [Burkholderiaceae bacterium DAT-1]|nr:branched-chain amino acid ABC transporter substrate-binding protein [Burkholderiaceae bacterium DAT-1]
MTQSLNRRTLITLATSLALSIPFACAAGSAVVKIGFAGPLTGPQAHYGEDMKSGIAFAIDEANASQPKIGGQPVKFELVAADDQADPRSATAVAQRFVDSGVNGIIGHFNSGTSIPASRIYSQAGIPQISMSTAPAYTSQGFKTTFRAMTSDTQQGPTLGNFAVKKLGLKRIAIVDDRSAYGQGLADQFEKAAKAAGADIVQREYTTDRATEFSAILTNIKAKRPDAIFYGGADTQSAPMVNQMRRLGMTMPLISGEMTRTDNFLKTTAANGNGVMVSLAGLPIEQAPGGAAFMGKLKAKYKAADFYAPFAYDATMTMIRAMQSANSADPKKYLPVLAASNVPGVAAKTIAWDTKGDLKNGDITIYKAFNGKWVPIESVTAGK